MPKKRNKPVVPAVFWRMFGNRARTLFDTIVSLLPPPPTLCRCRGLGCLGCAADAKSFLLRSDDPSDYRILLEKCFVVVKKNVPEVPFFFRCDLSQEEIVRRTIELMLIRKKPSSNVLCSGYDWDSFSSPIVKLLSCASWCLLLSRVGHYFMVYLLQTTAIFLPVPHGKHHQVAGPSISELCFHMLTGQQKRKRAAAANVLTRNKRMCHNSYSANGSLGFSSNTGSTSRSPMQIMCHDVSDSELPKPTRTGTVARKLELEGKPSSNCSTSRLGKRSRPFSWQRRSCKMQKKLTLEENCLKAHCNVLPTNADCLRSSFQPNTASLSYHAKLKMPWQCSCCLILQSLPAVPKRTDIKRQSIFYNMESNHLVFPKKHILYSLRPNLDYSKSLVGTIFGFTSAQPVTCLHSNGSCVMDSGCLYHSLVKWFKHLIRRTRCCQQRKLLNKHCVIPSLDKNTIGHSSSKLKNNVSETNVHKKYQEFGTKHCEDTVEATYSQSETFKSYCSKSQVVSFIWAVSRSLLPSELLGTPSIWRIMRRNISKFIHLRRFEKFPLKLCMHELKISSFPFLSNKYFLNSHNAHVLKYIEGKNKFIHKKFKNWNDAMHGVKRKLLEKWIFWYFSFLVVPLVQANFYVTESERGKQDIYYYPKPVWKKLVASTIACFKDWRYSYLNVAAVRNIVGHRPFGFSKLRLQPKENGVRMVANLKGSSRVPLLTSSMQNRKRKWSKDGGKSKRFFKNATAHVYYGKGKRHLRFKRYKSVNSVLQDAHTVLKGILLKDPNKLGSSVFDYNDVYKKLCSFLVGQKKGSASKANFFIVTADVLKAFDSIDQDRLLDIIKDFPLNDKNFFLKQYDQVVCTKKSLWDQKHFTLLDETNKNGHIRFTSFPSFHSRHGVFVSKEEPLKIVQKKEMYETLIEHVKRNVLQFDGKFYLQGVGIPQGGVLSTLLCSLYYGHLERHIIFPFLEKTLESGSWKETNVGQTNCNDIVSSSSYILMRFLDDFLFISTSKKQAASFFSRLGRGFRAYNCYMNKKKFGANFDVEQISDSPLNTVYAGEDGATSFLRWSGLLINCSTLEIQADYSKYLSSHLSSTLTVCWQGKPGNNLKKKLSLFLRPKCHPIFFDSNINSAAVVRLNIYQVFLLCAMKFHCYIRDLSIICKLNRKYCINIIQSSLRYLYLLIKKQIKTLSLNSDIQPILELEKEEVEWLGLHAYVQVLQRKQSRHKDLLTILRSRLSSSHQISSSVSSELKYAINTKNSSLLWDIKY